MEIYKFILENGNLVIINSLDNSVIWQGKPNNSIVKQIVELPEMEMCIVLLDPDQRKGTFRNLIAMDTNGYILWKAELPDPLGGDVYLDVSLQDDFLVAHSWSGFKVIIDTKSGRILSKKFTK